ncbi:hypothetical protein HYH03_010039 [Edaphochlamys debaryana]|uniref:Uncharacterized protein n=1 Tax=Edaphochlamys debaryana TaxID=47281 RepID=A0A835XXG5_9CHLO|nr:hypothetical protein HYH03_010039 [Edaphochlamys debaryana]|eukprot:KAG2491670.1 hypothetical protein HYH03_010039 [Edaphochlamys debaryana]
MLQKRGKDGSLPPKLDASELQDISDKIRAAETQLKGPERIAVAEGLLDMEPILVGMLQLIAAASRQQLSEDPAQLAVEDELQLQVGMHSCFLVRSLLEVHVASAAAVAAQRRCAEALLATKPLHASAVQLAAIAARVQDGAAAPSQAFGSAAAMALSSGLVMASCLTSAMVRQLGPGAASSAVTEAHLIEHTARLLLLLWRAYPSEAMRVRLLNSGCLVQSMYEGDTRVQAGPCARHAVMAMGLAALRELEGGAEGGAEGSDGGEAPCACRQLGPPRDTLGHKRALLALIAALHPSLPAPGPRPVSAARLLLRVGFGAAARAAAAAAGGGPGRDLTPAEASSGAGDCAHVSSAALHQLTAHLLRPWPQRELWLGLYSNAWRLADRLPAHVARVNDIEAVLHLSTHDWNLPAEAPGPLAAALEGGALPILERRLRRTGDTAAGQGMPVRTVRAGVPGKGGLVPGPATPGVRRAVAGSGPPRHRHQAAAGDGGAGAGGRSVAGGQQGGAAGGHRPPERCMQQVDLRPALPVRPAPPVPALSLALPDWLPKLSRLVREAAVLGEAAWRRAQEQQRGPQQQPGSGAAAAAGTESDMLADILLYLFCFGSTTAVASMSRVAPAAAAAADGGPRSAAAEGGPLSSSAAGGGGGLAWPPPGLAEAEVVGAALGLPQRRPPRTSWLQVQAGLAALRVAHCRPEEVRALCTSGSAHAWQPAALRSAAEALGGTEGYEALTQPLQRLRAQKPLRAQDTRRPPPAPDCSAALICLLS